MTIGDKILNMRKARGWSQEELADRLGVTRQAVSRWESGSAKPDADKIVDICDIFGVFADYLLRDKYAGEGELGSPEQETVSSSSSGPLVTSWQILGILMILSGVLVLAALGIMSAVNPHVYAIFGGPEYRGILGYIMGNDLWWLVIADGVVVLTGVILLVGRSIVKTIKNRMSKDAP